MPEQNHASFGRAIKLHKSADSKLHESGGRFIGTRNGQEPVPKSVEKKLILFYGHDSFLSSVKCVVTDAENYTWHHLDGDHHQHSLGNIIPLVSNLNSELNPRRKSFCLNPSLQAGQLMRRASLKFHAWDVAAAFGCAILAFYTGARPYGLLPKRSPQRLPMLRQALYYARHRFNKEIVEDLVQRELLPLLLNCVSGLAPSEAHLTLQEICALLGEEGEAQSAAALSRLIVPQKGMKTDAKASLLRRNAQSLGMVGARERLVRKLLDESRELDTDLNHQANLANTEAMIAVSVADNARLKRAHDNISSLFHALQTKTDRERKVPMTITNAAGIALFHAILTCVFRPRDWRPERDDALKLARKLFKDAGSGLWRLRPGLWEDTMRTIHSHGGDPGDLDLLIALQREPLSRKAVAGLHQTINLLGRVPRVARSSRRGIGVNY